jgi:uncharacterized protein
MRKLTVLVLTLLCVMACPGLRGETVKTMPKPTGYVDDYAGVFSSDARSRMDALCREVHDKTKAQIFVVTINTLDGSAVEEFSNELFHSWKIGEKKTDRGILILLAVKDHKYRVEVGFGFEGILNDAKAGDIGREMVPYLKSADYDGAAETSLSDVAKLIATDSNVTFDTLAALTPSGPPTSLPDAEQPDPASYKANRVLVWNIGIILMISAAMMGFFWFVARVIAKSSKGAGHSSSGSSSSSSSDDSSSSSSSDDDFSGGDGGDSGGGGASGSW